MNNTITSKEMRAGAKLLGYRLQCKTHSFNDGLVAVGFVHSRGTTTNCNCFHANFITEHKAIFGYVSDLSGCWLSDREQKIL